MANGEGIEGGRVVIEEELKKKKKKKQEDGCDEGGV